VLLRDIRDFLNGANLLIEVVFAKLNVLLRKAAAQTRDAVGGEFIITRSVVIKDGMAEAYGWQRAPRYIIRDRDRVYGQAVLSWLRAMGIPDQPIAVRSPWQNGCAERNMF